MKRKTILFLAAAMAMSSPSAWAMVGGPWDHLRGDSFSQSNSDGIYQASVTMPNGVGFVRFASRTDKLELADEQFSSQNLNVTGSTSGGGISSISNLATRSNSVVFFEGKTYFGNTYGNVELASGTVFGSSSGISALADQIRQSLVSGQSSSNTLIDISGLSESLNMSFTGKVFEKRPQIRFAASGRATFFSRPPIQVATVGTLVVLRVSAGGATSSTSTTTTTTTTNSVFPPTDPLDTGTGTTTNGSTVSISTSTSPTETSAASFPPDADVPIKLLGGRVSNVVPEPSNPLDLISGS